MSDVVRWENTGSLIQDGKKGYFYTEDLGNILQSSSESFEPVMDLKVHATKKYFDGQFVGYGLSADKKVKVWQHIDTSAQSKTQKEAFGILVLGPKTPEISYKASTEKKTFKNFKVLVKDAVVKGGWVSADPVSDFEKNATQLLNNANVKVVTENVTYTDIIDKPGNVE